MSYQRAKGGGGASYEGYAIGALALLALALVLGAWGAAELAAATNGAPKPPGDPFKLLGDLAGRGRFGRGRFAWAPADS